MGDLGFVRPPRLKAGDTVGLIAPSSPGRDEALPDKARQALERLGFSVKTGAALRKRHGFLAGSDRERAADVMAMFADPGVRGIFALRGGYGSNRIIPLLDFTEIRRTPKVFVGFSDLTFLHGALQRNAGLVSFHGPHPGSELMRDDCPVVTRDALLRTVMVSEPAGSISAAWHGRETSVRTVHGGKARGVLVGGNLTTLIHALGTTCEPNFSGCILCLEDVGEAPYRLDRMLTTLRDRGVLAQVAGVALGIFDGCNDPLATGAEYRQSVDDVIADRLGDLGIPVVSGLPFGHSGVNVTLPFGCQALLDGDAADLVILESGVK